MAWTASNRPLPDLATPRLRLREPTLADAPAVAALANDLDIARWLARMPHPYALDDAEAYIREVAPKEWAWLITGEADGGAMGVIALFAGREAESAELGYWLGRRFWGQGFATEAASAVLAHGRRALGRRRIAASHDVDNAASARVLAKLGFRPTGRSERPCRALDCVRPQVELRLVD